MNNKIFKISTISILIISLGLAISVFVNQKKIAFIDYNTVYNNCQIKKRLEKDLQSITNKRKNELDSLQMELSFLSEKIKVNNASKEEIGKFDEMRNRFMTFQEKYEEENVRLKETYFSQIRQEINDKAKEFALKKGYNYLFSAMGDGALMYGSESEDVTVEFQNFIDNK